MFYKIEYLQIIFIKSKKHVDGGGAHEFFYFIL